LMGGGVVIPLLFKDRGEGREKKILIVDRSPGGQLFRELEAAANQPEAVQDFQPRPKKFKSNYKLERVEPSADTPEAVQQQRLELSELIREREYAGLLEIGAGVYQPRQPDPAARTEPLPDALVLRYQSNSPLSGEFPHWVEEAVNDAIQRRR